MREITFIVENNLDKRTVMDVLRANNVSKRLIVKLKQIENGITKNGVHTRTIDTVCENDEITIVLEDKKVLQGTKGIEVPILFEDEDCVIYDKPPFMPVHPSHKHQGDTLGNSFAYTYKGLTFRPINRLDRDTSGCCVIAKNRFSAMQFQANIDKTYYAIVHGKITQGGRIDLPIIRLDNSIILRQVHKDGQRAVTHFEVLKYSEDYSFLKIKLETGRTHQIRVHFSHLGFPLVGDDMYGGKTDLINRQALHCGEIFFNKVGEQEITTISSTIPQDMEKLLKLF